MKLPIIAILAATLFILPAHHVWADDSAADQAVQSNDTSTKAATEPMSDERAHDTAGSTFDGNAVNDPGVVDLRDRTSDSPALLRSSTDDSNGHPVGESQ